MPLFVLRQMDNSRQIRWMYILKKFQEQIQKVTFYGTLYDTITSLPLPTCAQWPLTTRRVAKTGTLCVRTIATKSNL